MARMYGFGPRPDAVIRFNKVPERVLVKGFETVCTRRSYEDTEALPPSHGPPCMQ